MQTKEIIKSIIIIILYWFIVAILPIIFLPSITDNESLIFDYLVLIPLILFFIPYKLVKPDSRKGKMIIIIFGYIIPLIILYTHIFWEVVKGFNPSF